MSEISLKSRLLSKIPPFSRFYAAIAQQNAERIEALKRVEAAEVVNQELRQLVADTNARATAAAAEAHAAAGRDQFTALTALNNALMRERDLAAARLPDLELLKSSLDKILAAACLADQKGLATARGPSGLSGPEAADLYLDLIESELTGTLREDPSIDPWTSGYDPARRAIGRDWPSTAETMIGSARMRNIRTLLQRALADGVPGDVIETGVWRGGACIYMRAILAAAGDKARRVFVADSFKGLPEPSGDFAADTGDQHSTYEELAVSRDMVAANFKRYGMLDDRVVFLEGWFKDTLPAAPIEKLAVLRLDGDMYESTIQALEALYDKVSPGGYVIIDDYILKPCAEAVNDFRAARSIDAPMSDVDGAAVWWQVPRIS